MFVNDLRFQVYLHLWLLHISYYIDELYDAEIISFDIKLARDFECRDKNVKSILIWYVWMYIVHQSQMKKKIDIWDNNYDSIDFLESKLESSSL